MNALGSECTSGSGCESGWTLYLDNSFLNQNASHRYIGHEQHRDTRSRAKEEEDLSMVSDASSGPPHFPDDEPPPKSATKRQKVKESEDPYLPSFLHDTATSCVFHFSANEVAINNHQTSTDYSQGFSATYTKGRSSFHQHLSSLQSSLSVSVSDNELQGNTHTHVRGRAEA